MTFLAAARKASIRLSKGQIPQTFFSSNNKFEQEICDLSNEVVEDLVKRHDWRRLTVLKEMVGDGSTIGFDLPSDFDHMPKGAKVMNKDWATWAYIPVDDLNTWMMYLDGYPLISPGAWIILNGQMQFQPPVETGQTAQYFYISKNIVQNSGGTFQSQFTADTDSLIYDESLLTLGLIWMWRQQKRMDYAQDFDNYENRLEEITAQEKGSTIKIVGGNRWRSNYPFKYFGWGGF
jgi:hypothetical protein